MLVRAKSSCVPEETLPPSRPTSIPPTPAQMPPPKRHSRRPSDVPRPVLAPPEPAAAASTLLQEPGRYTTYSLQRATHSAAPSPHSLAFDVPTLPQHLPPVQSSPWPRESPQPPRDPLETLDREIRTGTIRAIRTTIGWAVLFAAVASVGSVAVGSASGSMDFGLPAYYVYVGGTLMQ
ncbi:hypothetical protein DFJ73DRAFT_760189 [Zopfochytrium polystomum]|nr:hypothetical protein DFJ73DRAFT_760189 [Zopfochytrium polystomum]